MPAVQAHRVAVNRHNDTPHAVELVYVIHHRNPKSDGATLEPRRIVQMGHNA